MAREKEASVQADNHTGITHRKITSTFASNTPISSINTEIERKVIKSYLKIDYLSLTHLSYPSPHIAELHLPRSPTDPYSRYRRVVKRSESRKKKRSRLQLESAPPITPAILFLAISFPR